MPGIRDEPRFLELLGHDRDVGPWLPRKDDPAECGAWVVGVDTDDER